MKTQKTARINRMRRKSLVVAVFAFAFLGFASVLLPATTQAACKQQTGKSQVKIDANNPAPKDCCGSGKDAVGVSIDVGCRGSGNPIIDMTFAIIRFLSIGVGIIIVASLVWAGVQYTMARDDPAQVAAAKSRIMSTFGALLLYIFAYALLNYVIPAGFF